MIKISVNKSQRDDKSDVCYLATQLELKVIRMTMNEKYFPKRARFVISNKIIECATDLAANFIAANDIFPNNENKLEIREKYQVIGKSRFVSLKHELNVAHQLFNIPSGVMDEVFDLISQIDKKYSNWFKSGRKVLKRELAKQEAKNEPNQTDNLISEQ